MESKKTSELTDCDAKALLAELAKPGHLDTPPGREAMLDQAILGDTSHRRNPGIGYLPLLRRPAVIGFIGVAILAGFFAAQTWFAQPRYMSSGGTFSLGGSQPKHYDSGSLMGGDPLAPETAWASVDGVALEYECIRPNKDSALLVDEPSEIESIQNAIDGVIAKYGHLDLIPGARALAYLDGCNGRDIAGWKWRLTRVIVACDNQDLLRELKAEIEDIPGIWGPREYSKTFFYNEKYPDLVVPGQTIFLNGEAKRVPFDFEEYQMRYVLDLLKTDPGTVSYKAHWRLDSPEDIPMIPDIFKLGDIVRIEAQESGDIRIDTIAQEAEFQLAEEHQSVMFTKIIDVPDTETEEVRYMPVVSLSFTSGEVPDDFDPHAALQAEYDKLAVATNSTDDSDFRGYQHYYMLFPPDRFRSNLNYEFSEEEKAWSFELLDAAKSAADEFGRSHEDIQLRPNGMKVCYVAPIVLGEEVAIFLRAAISTSNPGTAEQFKELVDGIIGLPEMEWEY